MVALKRVFGWIRRAFIGDKLQLEERVESPSRLAFKALFKRKSALVAAIGILSLFLFTFIAPLFVPMDINYTDPLQQNVAPCLSLRKIPKRLRGEIAQVDGFSDFTIGLSQSGKVFVWGNGKNALNDINVADIPLELAQSGAEKIAAGKDHALAISHSGKLIGWGDKSCGQYGTEQVLNAVTMPAFLGDGWKKGEVKQLVCGYQVSALVTTDGKAYAWGNVNAVPSLRALAIDENVEKAAFTNSALVYLKKDGTLRFGERSVFISAVRASTGERVTLDEYLLDKKVRDLAASNKCLVLLLENGELLVSGVFENGEENVPVLENGEYFQSIAGGTRHFVAVSNFKKAYAWGDNSHGQCNVQTREEVESAYAGAAQTYLVGVQGELIKSVGLKGHIFGTDGRGRDVFTRIVHGGKMTLLIGVVAVLISSFIGILVGCTAGYFGGKIDVLLMRVTEIFSSIPFLPFAMLLSQVIKHYNVSDTMRIFIIMLILGLLSWTGLARMIRGQVLAEREKEFVLAARSLGVKESKIAFKHVLLNVVSVIVVSMTLEFAGCLLTESALSYLGFGVQQPYPTWGNMLTGCNNSVVIQNYWWQWLFPALFLSFATICVNVLGDALRDALDPRSNHNKRG